MFATAGEPTPKDMPIASILPDNSELEATLMAPATAMGWIRQGQHVNVRFDSFSYQRYGTADALVARISTAGISPNELATGTFPKTPVYRITAKLRRQTFLVDGRDIALQPGMQVSAQIVLDRRSLWSLIFDSLTGRK